MKPMKLTKEQVESLTEAVNEYNDNFGRPDGWHIDIAMHVYSGDCWTDWNGPNEWREYDDTAIGYINHILVEFASNDEWDPDKPTDAVENPRLDVNKAIGYIESQEFSDSVHKWQLFRETS